MARIVKPSEAFESCHGYKMDGQLMLWTDGAIGMLSDNQEKACEQIYLNNASPRPRVFDSVEEAMEAEVRSNPDITRQVAETEREVTRKEVQNVFAHCARRYEGLPAPEFQKKVGECVDKAFPSVGEY